jgi:hypothetical protein
VAGGQVRRLLRRNGLDPSRSRRPAETPAEPSVRSADVIWLRAHTAAMAAALAGWFFCALFSSVAYNWTFYYLLALAIAPREILTDRLAAVRKSRKPAARTFRVQEIRA